MGSFGKECRCGEDKSSSVDSQDHTYILSFESLKLIWSHKQLEPILLENHWRPVTPCICARWREYHYYKPKFSSLQEDILLKKVRLPEPIEDAPKKDILKFVRTVNETARRNILCAWVHRGPKIAPCMRTMPPTEEANFRLWKCSRCRRPTCSAVSCTSASFGIIPHTVSDLAMVAIDVSLSHHSYLGNTSCRPLE